VIASLHRAHHDFAGVDTDAGLDARTALPPQFLAAAAEICGCENETALRAQVDRLAVEIARSTSPDF